VVSEMARVNPAAFRSMFAEAARVMAGLDERGANGQGNGPTLREEREGWGAQKQRNTHRQDDSVIPNEVRNLSSMGRDERVETKRDSSGKNGPQNDNSRGTAANANHPSRELRASESRVTNQPSPVTGHQSPQFDSAAYAAFERSTNETVARDVRGSISETLARVMPEGVAEGAARRIGEDIFGEVHRALAGDRALSEQVASVLRGGASLSGAAGGPPSPNDGYGGLRGGVRFGSAEQQRVAAIVAGRAKQLVPSVARRVIGEWTSSVLSTARSKAARQAAAAARVDIAAPGGSSDSMPLRAMSAREVNYASMSDEQILGL
jgi:hypothetical protein